MIEKEKGRGGGRQDHSKCVSERERQRERRGVCAGEKWRGGECV